MTVTIQCASVKPEVLDLQRRQVPESPDQLFVTSTSRAAANQQQQAGLKTEYTEYDAQTGEQLSKSSSGPPAYEEQCLQIQLDDAPKDTRVVKCTNGLVHTLETAYNQHLHLVLRYV